MLPVLAALGLFLTPFKATLTAPTHRPKVNARWSYSVSVVDSAGKPLRARLTAQVVDPFGGTHPVQVGTSTKNIVRLPFRGTFRDFVQWPPESRGFKLTFRATVTSGGRSVELTYWVRPR
jgi:hypothetical protein